MNKLSKMAIIAVSGLLFLTGCSEASRVSENLSLESDNFNVVRKVTVIDAITNDVMFQMSGRMSIKADTHDKQLEIVVENGKNKYQKHIIGLSDNVSYVVEDVEAKMQKIAEFAASDKESFKLAVDVCTPEVVLAAMKELEELTK